jgi:hypothetical protein
LRYEVGNYIETRQKFPPVGSRVSTSLGDGIIDRIDIFQEEAVLRTEDNVFVRVPLKEFQPDPEPVPLPSEEVVGESEIPSGDDDVVGDDDAPAVEPLADTVNNDAPVSPEPPAPSEPEPPRRESSSPSPPAPEAPQAASDDGGQPKETGPAPKEENGSKDAKPPRRRFRRRRPRRPRNNSQ